MPIFSPGKLRSGCLTASPEAAKRRGECVSPSAATASGDAFPVLREEREIADHGRIENLPLRLEILEADGLQLAGFRVEDDQGVIVERFVRSAPKEPAIVTPNIMTGIPKAERDALKGVQRGVRKSEVIRVPDKTTPQRH